MDNVVMNYNKRLQQISATIEKGQEAVITIYKATQQQ